MISERTEPIERLLAVAVYIFLAVLIFLSAYQLQHQDTDIFWALRSGEWILSNMAVPTIVIALRDEKGEEISEWTTEVGSAELKAGEEAPFLRQIPSPPSNVRSIKVRFTQAN